jgi:hypothetical protein
MEVSNASGDVAAVLSGWVYQTNKEIIASETNP